MFGVWEEVGGSGGCRCGVGGEKAERAWKVGEGKRWDVDKGVNVRCGWECGTGRGGGGRWTWLDSGGGRMRTKVVVEGGGGRRRWGVAAEDGGEGLVGTPLFIQCQFLAGAAPGTKNK